MRKRDIRQQKHARDEEKRIAALFDEPQDEQEDEQEQDADDEPEARA